MLYDGKNYSVDNNENVLISSKKVCEIYNISPQTLANYYKSGLPRAKHGWLELVSMIQWFTNVKNADNSDNFTEADKLNADVKLKKAKEELAQIEIAVKNGELVEMSTVAATLEKEFSKLKTSMLLIGDNVMAKVVLQYPELAVQVRSLINDGIRKGLEELARSGGNIKPAETSRPRKKAGRPRKVNK